MMIGDHIVDLGMSQDMTPTRNTKAILRRQNIVLNLIVADASIERVFAEIVQQVEAMDSNVICGITAVDGDGVIHVWPSLPMPSINLENVKEVITFIQRSLENETFLTDAIERACSQRLDDLALRVTEVWSKPIYGPDGNPMGLFVLMYKNTPSDRSVDQEIYQVYAHMIAMTMERKQSEKAIFINEKRYKSLYDNNIDAVFQFDLDGYFVDVNDSFLKTFGYTLSELRHMSFRTILVDEDVEKATAVFERTKTGHTTRHEVDALHRFGKRMTVQVISVPIMPEGKVVGTFGIVKDMTANRYAQKLLENQKRILEMTATRSSMEEILYELTRVVEYHAPSSMCNVWLFENEQRSLRHVVGHHRLKGYADDLASMNMGPAAGACGTAAFLNELVTVEDIEHDPLFEKCRDLPRSHGLRACFATPIVSNHDEVVGVFGLYFDHVKKPTLEELELLKTASHLAGLVVERERYDAHIRFLAHHDALTGLPNRSLFVSKLNEALQHAKQEDQALTLLFLDLDQFKAINDSMGHYVGDRLLQLVADRLQNCLQSTDVLCRMGGDEFTLFRPSIGGTREAVSVAQCVIDSFHPSFKVGDHWFRVTVSIGVAISTVDVHNAHMLMRNADSAMYEAKRKGKNMFSIYKD